MGNGLSFIKYVKRYQFFFLLSTWYTVSDISAPRSHCALALRSGRHVVATTFDWRSVCA